MIAGFPDTGVELDGNERERSDSEGWILDWFKPIAAKVVAKVGF